MNFNLKPFSQDQSWATLIHLSKKLPQGLILIGPSGVGKKRAVRALFQFINCQSPAQDHGCGSCSSCKKIAEGNHVDLVEIHPKGSTIQVDDLREMKKHLFFPPTEAKFRFVLIDEAHRMNSFSANNLLKTLEEPPSHTKFFLVTHERGLLLPTIISRCQFTYFAPLSHETLQTLLRNQAIELPQKHYDICLELLGGGLEKAQWFSQERVLNFIEEVQEHLIHNNSRPRTIQEINLLAEKLTSNAQESTSTSSVILPSDWKLELFFDLIILNNSRSIHKTSMSDLNSCYKDSSLALDATYLRRRLDLNANKKLMALAASSLVSQK